MQCALTFVEQFSIISCEQKITKELDSAWIQNNCLTVTFCLNNFVISISLRRLRLRSANFKLNELLRLWYWISSRIIYVEMGLSIWALCWISLHTYVHSPIVRIGLVKHEVTVAAVWVRLLLSILTKDLVLQFYLIVVLLPLKLSKFQSKTFYKKETTTWIQS